MTHCPHDGVQLEAEICSGGSLLVSCPACDAEWEWHGAWLRRVQEPDREAVRAATQPRRTETTP